MPNYVPVKTDRIITRQVNKSYVHTLDQQWLARNTFLTDIRQPMMVIQDIAPRSIFAFLGTMPGGISVGEQPFQTSEGTVNRLVSFWDVKSYRKEPGYVVDNSTVPASVRGGEDFVVTMTGEPFYQFDQLLSADDKTIFFVKNILSSDNGRSTYTLQLVANNTDEPYPIAQLFEYGKPLNYLGNAHPEASSFGRGLDTGQSWRYYNNTQTSRRELNLTGHAASDAAMDYIEYGMAGEQPTGVAPLSRRLVQEQMADCNRTALKGKSNYNPRTGKFTNQNDNGKYKDNYMTSGYLEQWESTRHVLDYFLYDTDQAMLDFILGSQQHIYQEMGGNRFRTVLFTGNLGQEKIKRAFLRYANNIAVNQRVLSKNADERYKAGFIVDAIQTEFGEIVVYNYELGIMEQGRQFDEFQLGAARGSIRSADIFAVPIFDDPNLEGSSNLRMHFKQQQVDGLGLVNRALVVGRLTGMTGATTGRGDLNVTGDIFRSLYQVTSPVDAEALHLLTEFMPIYATPDKVWWIRANV